MTAMGGPKDIRVIALDFDGVLVDSVEAKRLAYDDVFAQYPARKQALTRLREAHPSANRVVFFRRAAGEVFGAPGDEAVHQKLMMELSAAMIARVSVCPDSGGARRFLAALDDWPVYIVSLTPEADLREIVHARALSRSCCDVYGCPPYAKQDALRAIVGRERLLSAAEVLLVGDTTSDAEAARDVGARCVLVGNAAFEGDVGRADDLDGVAAWLLGSHEARSA